MEPESAIVTSTIEAYVCAGIFMSIEIFSWYAPADYQHMHDFPLRGDYGFLETLRSADVQGHLLREDQVAQLGLCKCEIIAAEQK